jgi:hypothetical protein
MKLKIGETRVIGATRKNRGPSYGPETKWAMGVSKDTASAVLNSLQQVKTHSDEVVASMVQLKGYAPDLFAEMQGKVLTLSETVNEAIDEYRQFVR